MSEDSSPIVRDTEGAVPTLKSLADLLFRPSVFFKTVDLDSPPLYRLILLAWGMTEVSGRIDQNIMRAELGQPRPGWEEFAPSLLGSWLSLWAFLLVLGALGGVFHWYVGGWWYRVRLRWSGAVDPSPRLARLVMTWAGLILAAPTVITLLIATFLVADYEAYWTSEEVVSSILLVFPFWSVVASYKGVRASFEVSPWKSRLWFLILPIVLFVVGLGILATLYAFFA